MVCVRAIIQFHDSLQSPSAWPRETADRLRPSVEHPANHRGRASRVSSSGQEAKRPFHGSAKKGLDAFLHRVVHTSQFTSKREIDRVEWANTGLRLLVLFYGDVCPPRSR